MEEKLLGDSHPVLNWLGDRTEEMDWSEPDLAQLVRWLEGDDGATAAETLSPVVWILDSCRFSAFPRRIQIGLAKCCGYLLYQRPDKILLSKEWSLFSRPGQYIHNLLRLCSELPEPTILWKPLMLIYSEDLLPERFENYSLKDPLRAALIRNQFGPDLKEEWFGMIRGRRRRLPGTRESGLRGVIFMPKAPEMLGTPWSAEITQGLKEMALQIQDERNRSALMRQYVGWVRAAYGSLLSEYEFVGSALEKGWPGWAVEANWLYVKAPSVKQGWWNVYTWKHLAACIPNTYVLHELRQDRSGDFLHAEISGETMEYIDEIAPLFLQAVGANPFSSVGAMICVVAATMYQLESRMRLSGRIEAADAILKARAQVLDRVFVATKALHPEKSTALLSEIVRIKAGDWGSDEEAARFAEEWNGWAKYARLASEVS